MKQKTIDLLQRIELAGRYFRSAAERRELRRLTLQGAVRPLYLKFKPKEYHARGHCLYELTQLGKVVLEVLERDRYNKNTTKPLTNHYPWC